MIQKYDTVYVSSKTSMMYGRFGMVTEIGPEFDKVRFPGGKDVQLAHASLVKVATSVNPISAVTHLSGILTALGEQLEQFEEKEAGCDFSPEERRKWLQLHQEYDAFFMALASMDSNYAESFLKQYQADAPGAVEEDDFEQAGRLKVYDENVEIEILRGDLLMKVRFCDILDGDRLWSDPTVVVASDAHKSGDASYDGWLFFDTDGKDYYPEDFGAMLVSDPNGAEDEDDDFVTKHF